MPLQIPTRRGVTDALRNYTRDALPALDPSTDRRSYIGGMVKSLASAITDWHIALKRYADREPFPQTATGDFLTKGWWIDIAKIHPNPASAAHGYVAVTGVAGTSVPVNTLMQGASITYKVMQSTSIVEQTTLASSITVSDITGLCTFKAPAPHYFATGMTVVIKDAAPAEYNGTVAITVTGEDTFTYEPLYLPIGTAAGGKAVLTFASVFVEATTLGQTTNLDSGAEVSITSAPNGVDPTARVTYGGIAGGSDVENLEVFRQRVLKILGTDFGMFTPDEIAIVVRRIPGVTRVMVRKATFGGTNGVLEGQVKIAFLRDNDSNPLPSAQEVADVKAELLSLAMPAHMAPEDLIVMSPTPYPVNFSFSSIVPDTPGMRRAIQASLKQFFAEEANWGEPISIDAYRCAIFNSYDTESRQKLRTFALILPVTQITPGADDMPTLGTVTF